MLDFISQGLRSAKLQTLEQIQVLEDRVKKHIAERAAAIKAGTGIEAVAGIKRKGSTAIESTKKRRRGQDLPDDSDIQDQQQQCGLDFAYMLWGFSQKIQIAGVCRSVMSRSGGCRG